MSRSVDLDETALRIRLDGLDGLLALKRELKVPYHAVADVAVGASDVPSPWTVRRIGTADPVSGTRKGRFTVDGRRWFLDLRRPERALVLRLKPGHGFDAIALEVDHAESLAEAIRARLS